MRSVSRTWLLGTGLAVALLANVAVMTMPTSAQVPGVGAPTAYVRIEEDWEVEISEPDSSTASPQIASQMSPSESSPVFCNFKINCRELPNVEAGGLQVQIWRNDAAQAHKSYSTLAAGTRDEKITWTQYMERNKNSHRLSFGISKASSLTWGNFSSANLVAKYKQYAATDDVLAADESETDFTNYSSDYSVKYSGITFGSNRVVSLKLMQVRKYRNNELLGLLPTDVEAVPRVVWNLTGQ